MHRTTSLPPRATPDVEPPSGEGRLSGPASISLPSFSFAALRRVLPGQGRGEVFTGRWSATISKMAIKVDTFYTLATLATLATFPYMRGLTPLLVLNMSKISNIAKAGNMATFWPRRRCWETGQFQWDRGHGEPQGARPRPPHVGVEWICRGGGPRSCVL
jgi:hypothetical protein